MRGNSVLTFWTTLNNVAFTSPFFKTLSNQTINIKKIITITEQDFYNNLEKNDSNNSIENETLYIGRKRNGKLVGSYFIDKNAKFYINYTDFNKQFEIIRNNELALSESI